MTRPAFLPSPPLRPPRSSAIVARRSRCATPRMDHLLSTVDAVDWLPHPVAVRGPVQRGFGRGSRDFGTPTANLSGKLVADETALSRDGVYLGFGRVPGLLDGAVVKMVANLGRNITFDDVPERVLEAFLMDTYPRDFYGDEMRLVIVGFMRPELKFDGVDDLLKHIRNDVAVAKKALDLPAATPARSHASLVS